MDYSCHNHNLDQLIDLIAERTLLLDAYAEDQANRATFGLAELALQERIEVLRVASATSDTCPCGRRLSRVSRVAGLGAKHTHCMICVRQFARDGMARLVGVLDEALTDVEAELKALDFFESEAA